MLQYLPIVASVIVAIIAAYGSIKVGSLKNAADARALITTAEGALRDDLELALSRYEKREQFLLEKLSNYEKQIGELRSDVDKYRIEVTDMKIQNRECVAELERARRDLREFTDKVWYIPKEKTGEHKE